MPWFILLFVGAAWGLTFSLGRVAVVAGGSPATITFWQALAAGLCLLPFSAKEAPPVIPTRHFWAMAMVVAALTLLIPNYIFYQAVRVVPSGVLAITASVVPMSTYALALVLGKERLGTRRLAGLAIGVVAILVLILPETGLPTGSAWPWVLLACLGSFCYAVEATVVARWPDTATSPIRLALAMNITSVLVLGVYVVLASPDGLAAPFRSVLFGLSVLGLGLINAICYTLYIRLINHHGPVFASQMSYIVTVTGVLWGIVLLAEVHSDWVWLALILMLCGLAMVLPRRSA